jgi:hypothetical protein
MVRKHPKNNFSAQVHESQFIEQKPFSIKNISGKPENLDIKSSDYTSQKINKYDSIDPNSIILVLYMETQLLWVKIFQFFKIS